MAGRTSINEVAAASAMTSTVTSNLAGATSTASLTTATTTVSAIRDVSTASGRPSRRDQLNSGTAPQATSTTTTTSNRGVQPPRSGVNTTSAVAGAAGVVKNSSQITSRSYAGSPTGHYPGPVNGYGRGNVPQSISSSAFTIGTSRYTSDQYNNAMDPRMDPMDRTGRGGMAGGPQMAGGMAGGMTGQMAGGMAGQMGGMAGGMAGGPAGTGPMDHHRSTSMPGNMGPQGMGPAGAAGGMMHGRSRSASRGMPGNRGPGYHSLDREGYTDRDFMPIREPRERSLDRDFAYGGGGYGAGAGGYAGAGGTAGTGAYGRRERSLDRRGDPMLDPEDGFYTGGRDPMMAGRDPMAGPRGRTGLSPNPNMLGAGMGPVGPPVHPSAVGGLRDNYLSELQSGNSELQRDLANLRKELELTNQKLGSSMHSIKTFWSPELKKERALRKEESAKYSLINDQLKLLNSENQVFRRENITLDLSFSGHQQY